MVLIFLTFLMWPRVYWGGWIQLNWRWDLYIYICIYINICFLKRKDKHILQVDYIYMYGCLLPFFSLYMFQSCARQRRQKPCMNNTKTIQMPFSSQMGRSSSLAPVGLKRMSRSIWLDLRTMHGCASTGRLEAWGPKSVFSQILANSHTPIYVI